MADNKRTPKTIQPPSPSGKKFMPTDVDADTWSEIIAACEELRVALMIGYSRDGGAFFVKMYADEFKMDSHWCKSEDDLLFVTEWFLKQVRTRV